MKCHPIFPVILFGLSNLANANDVLTAPEKTAFSLLGSVMDIVSAKVDASSCNELKGQYQLTLFVTGVGGQRRQNNIVTAALPVHPVSVIGYPKNKIPEVGTRILTNYTRTSNYDDFDPVIRYSAAYDFNSTDSLLAMAANLELKDRYFDIKLLYSTGALSNFTRSSSSDIEDEYATYIGWGMSWLSNPEFPKSKNWLRFKISRDAGINAHTFLARDLLVHSQPCRIKIAMSGHNSLDSISQEGHITIEMAMPDDSIGVSFD